MMARGQFEYKDIIWEYREYYTNAFKKTDIFIDKELKIECSHLIHYPGSSHNILYMKQKIDEYMKEHLII